MLAAKPQKRAKLRHSEYYDLQGRFDTLYAQSKEGRIFTDLLPMISTEENIMLAFRNIKRNKGSGTRGMDPVTIGDNRRHKGTDRRKLCRTHPGNAVPVYP